MLDALNNLHETHCCAATYYESADSADAPEFVSCQNGNQTAEFLNSANSADSADSADILVKQLCAHACV